MAKGPFFFGWFWGLMEVVGSHPSENSLTALAVNFSSTVARKMQSIQYSP